MPGSFFKEILESHKDHLNENFYTGKPFTLKVKTVSADGMKLRHKFKIDKKIEDQVASGSDKVNQVAKYGIRNAAIATYSHHGLNGKVKMSQDIFEAGLKVVPESLNKDQVFEVSEELRRNKTGDWQSKTKLNYGSPQFGPARLWLNLAYKWNNKMRLYSNCLNAQVQDNFHIGYALRHDGENFKELKWHIIKQVDKANWFLRGNVQKKYLVLGHSNEFDGKPAAFELKYDLTGENPGLFGSHIEAKACRTIVPKEGINFRSRFKIGADVIYDNCWIQKVDDNFDIHVMEHLNLTNWFLNPAKHGWNFGIKVQYHF